MVELLYILVHLTHTKYIAVVCVLHVHEGGSACMHMHTNSTMEVHRLTLLHAHTHTHTFSIALGPRHVRITSAMV